MPTFHDLVQDLAKDLVQEYRDPVLAEQTASWLLSELLQTSAAQLVARATVTLSPEQQQTVAVWKNEIILRHKPLAYILRYVPFNDLKILVEQPILIPRPETEEWTSQLVEKLAPLATQKLTILDIGTGTGCVALTLAKHLPESIVYASDISVEALKLAQKNASENRITNVKFLHSDVFDQIPADKKFDLIVANPPYISDEEWNELDPAVTEWEDKKALVAHQQGLEIIEKIVAGAHAFLTENKELERQGVANLIIEIGHRQGAAVQRLLQDHGYSNITIVKDMEGKDRTAHARG